MGRRLIEGKGVGEGGRGGGWGGGEGCQQSSGHLAANEPAGVGIQTHRGWGKER